MTLPEKPLFAGVIEGFYGPPWSQAERFTLFDWMAAWKLNSYLYAPKDDLKHRAFWRELYTEAEAEGLRELIRGCTQRGLRFGYGLGPGLDIRFSSEAEIDLLRARFAQMLGLGCTRFVLLFDDIPDRMDPEDRRRFGSFASAQAHVANTLFRWVGERSPAAQFWFCPTPYCGRMAERGYGGTDYLATIGRELLPEIEVFWTGPEIISREITVEHVRELQHRLRRKPLIWDNLHANDYDGRRCYCGPYSGRPIALRAEVSGLMVNPNNEFPLNYVPLRTLATFVHHAPGTPWDPRAACLAALQEWEPQFTTYGSPLSGADLRLFVDSYYLPYELGPEAEALFQRTRRLVAAPAAAAPGEIASLREELARLRNFCQRLTELRDRPLFYALSRRAWELREELDLLDRFFEFHSQPNPPAAGFTSDFHQPGTYRGGLVPQLQRLLVQHPDGTFTPACTGAVAEASA
jgi:hypothetical protein